MQSRKRTNNGHDGIAVVLVLGEAIAVLAEHAHLEKRAKLLEVALQLFVCDVWRDAADVHVGVERVSLRTCTATCGTLRYRLI